MSKLVSIRHQVRVQPQAAKRFSTTSISMVRHKKDNFGRGRKNLHATRSLAIPLPASEHLDGARQADDCVRSRPAFRAACWDLNHCDAKRCSGKRLVRLGMMRELSIGQKFAGIVVSCVS